MLNRSNLIEEMKSGWQKVLQCCSAVERHKVLEGGTKNEEGEENGGE